MKVVLLIIRKETVYSINGSKQREIKSTLSENKIMKLKSKGMWR